MNDKIKRIFEEQEKEDAYKISEGLQKAINEEVGNAEYLMKQIERYRLHKISEAFDFSIRENIVRISAEFSIRKHSVCLVPYYHSHDFYEMIYVWQGQCTQNPAGETEDLNLSAGNLCILTPGMAHAILPCSETDVILKIIIPNP